MSDRADDLRRILFPIELAEAELRAKPAAAVMLVLREGDRGFEILLGERARREGDPWSGQIGFPGGRRHVEDGTMLATGLRETREEVGLDLNGRAEVLGHLSPRAPGNRPEMLVVPYVALAHAPLAPVPGPEMTSTFWVRLEDLPPTRTTAVVPTILGELTASAFAYEARIIWGFTYRILEELLVLLGLSA